MAAAANLCERGGHAVVGGAYFGDQVILMARRLAQAGGTCHAFEPNADQLGMLRNNATLNHVQNIRSWRLGLWSDRTTQLRLVGHDFVRPCPSTATAAAGDDSFCHHHHRRLLRPAEAWTSSA